MAKASIKNQAIGIVPSPALLAFIKTLDDVSLDIPANLLDIYQAVTKDNRKRNICQPPVTEISFNEEEKKMLTVLSDDTFQGTTDLSECLEALCLHQSVDTSSDSSDIETLSDNEPISKNKARQLRAKKREKELSKLVISLTDLKWLHEYLIEGRRSGTTYVYLHELIKGSKLMLPANEVIERNPELEKRCQRLKREQDEKRYRMMTKNVDSRRTYEPDETIASQVKQINRQLIAVLQFIVSVAAGFAFGFTGVELMVGNLDFGFRLLLGIICALIIALAEIYFLAKKLNEDLQDVSS